MRPANEVEAQYAKLVAAIPSLMPQHAGRWAVFLDTFRGSFESQWEALDWATANLGDDAPFTIARVEEPRTVLMTAALAFGGAG